MYDLNSAYEDSKSQGGGGDREFKEHVKIKRLKISGAQQEVHFRILPSFGVNDLMTEGGVTTIKNKRGWNYFKEPQGGTNAKFTTWARMLFSWNFLGHGSGTGGGGNRITIIAPQSFDCGGGQIYDPVADLRQRAQKDPQWKYLTEDVMSGDTRIEAAPIPYLKKELIFNMIDIYDLEKGVQLGLLGKSGYESLIGDKGLANSRNFQVREEAVAENPMALWQCGDLTNLATGPVLKLKKEQGKGRYASYMIEMGLTQDQSQIATWPISEDFLDQRVVLDDPLTFMNKLTEQQVIDKLVKVLDGLNPITGEHEHVFLKRVFGDRFEVPDPPAGYGAGQGIPSGVGFNAPGGGIPGLGAPPAAPGAVPGAGIPGAVPPPAAPPGAGIPGAVPSPAAPPASVPGLNAGAIPPPPAVPTAGNAPAATPPSASVPPAATPSSAPQNTAVPTASPSEGNVQPPAASAPAPSAAGQQTPTASTASTAAPTTSPSNVPGTVVPPANDKKFLNMLNGDKSN